VADLDWTMKTGKGVAMYVRSSFFLAVPIAVMVTVACDSSNPARPSMSVAAPTVASPADGTTYGFSQQPITVTFANATRSGSAPVTYVIEVATSPGFGTIATALTDVPEGNGVTTVTLPVLAGNATYYWRIRPVVDGIAGASSPASSFVVRPAVTIGVPAPIAPADGASVGGARPAFVVENAARSGPAGNISYEFQVSESAAFGALTATGVVAEQPSRTSWTPGVDLPTGKLFWRSRGLDQGNDVAGPFSSVQSFERRRGGAPGDQLDLSTVTVVLGPANIGTWPATGVVTSTVARPGEICIEHTQLGGWPGTAFFDDPGTLTQGNQWMFAFIGGRWYGGGGRWYRPGQACKSTNADDGFTGTFYMEGAEPLRSYVPRPGDLIGLMSSTPARFYPGMRTVDERTNVVVVPWGN